MIPKRFIVYVGPGGYLTANAAGAPVPYGKWSRLISVRRPFTTKNVHAAFNAAVRVWGL